MNLLESISWVALTEKNTIQFSIMNVLLLAFWKTFIDKKGVIVNVLDGPCQQTDVVCGPGMRKLSIINKNKHDEIIDFNECSLVLKSLGRCNLSDINF